MIWLIQSGFNDGGYLSLIESLERLSIEYYLVDVIPFGGGYKLPDGLTTKDIIVYGSSSFIQFAKDQCWTPGSYINDNFAVDVWAKHYKEELLNSDSMYGTIINIEIPYEHFFIRPVYDNKKFSGMLMHRDEFESWRSKILDIPDEEYSTIKGNTEICISTIKQIIVEYRLFVVDGKVVTGSEYKRGDCVAYYEFIPEYILEYAKTVIDMWVPDNAFCLDIAEILIDDKPYCKVLEINCINGCGLYMADTDKYVYALTNQGKDNDKDYL